jgi:hypothetical protein
MNTNKSLKSTWERSTTRRFLRWISSWRVLRRFLFGIAVLVTMVFLFYAIENWRGNRAWDRYQADAAARGTVGDWKAFVPPPVSDAENFATTPFLAPLFEFKSDPGPGESPWRDTNALARAQGFAGDLPYIREQGNWRHGQRTDLAAYVTEFETKRASATPGAQPADSEQDRVSTAASLINLLSDTVPVIEEFRTASERPKSRFAIRYDQENPAGILLPHLSVTKRVCQVLKLRALASFEKGDTESGFEDLRLMFRIAETHREEPFLISQLVRLAETQIALQVLWEGLADHRFTEPQLVALQSNLQEPDIVQGMDHSLRAERAFGIKIIDWIRAHPDRISMLGFLDGGSGDGAQAASASVLIRLAPRGWFQFEKLNYARLFEEYLLPSARTRADRVDPVLVERQIEELDQVLFLKAGAITEHQFLAKMLLPALSKVIVKAAYGQCVLSLADTACALERFRISHGSYPEQLQELVPQYLEKLPLDVITGDSLIYRRFETGRFILYSVGWNQTDDGGQYLLELSAEKEASGRPSKKTSSSKGLGLEEGDWVWTQPEA